jgi:cytochrome o ubiquinol oxidase subunit II
LNPSRAAARGIRTPRALSRWRAPAVPVAAGLLLSGCQLDVLDPQGPVGAGDRAILMNAVVIMLVIVVPTIVAILAFAWWFRAGNRKAVYLPNWAFSGRIELVTWSIPFLTVMFLGGVAWVGSHLLDPAAPLESSGKPVEVQVVSLDWKWLFIYPEQQVASVNDLVIPAGTPVHFTLTSASVMTAFFVPRLGSMIYTMNGMSTQLNLQADHPGTYYGEAAHFSGDGFADMHFAVRALPTGGFADWVKTAQGAGQTLDRAAYMTLEQQSANVQPFTYRSVAPNLYQQIVTQTVPPGPGPQEGRPTPDVSPRTKAGG